MAAVNLKEQAAVDWFPHIDWTCPEAERPYKRHVSDQILMLRSHEQKFGSALDLLDHIDRLMDDAAKIDDPSVRLKTRGAIGKWMFFPVEGAAFELYHFQSTLRSIRDQLSRAPSLAKKVDTKALQAAFDRFHAEFPQWKAIRDSIGHYADKQFRPEDIDKLRGDGGPVIHGGLGRRRLTFTINGEPIHFDATRETLERLRSIKMDAYLAFRHASEWPLPEELR